MILITFHVSWNQEDGVDKCSIGIWIIDLFLFHVFDYNTQPSVGYFLSFQLHCSSGAFVKIISLPFTRKHAYQTASEIEFIQGIP